MRRLAVALLVPLAATVALAGCGSSAAPSSSAAQVKVTAVTGKAPSVQIPAQQPSGSLVTKTLVQGTGPVLAPGDSYLANFDVYVWRGKTHKLLFSSYATTPEVLPVTMSLSGLQKAVAGQRVGSRVLAVLPPKYGYGAQGNSQIGVRPTDTLVWVIDVIQSFPPNASASGTHITDGGGALPTVHATPGNSPQISIPKNTPPSKLVVKTLIKGTGTPVKAGQAIVVRYVGSIWRTGKVFNDNWPSITQPTVPPNVFVLGQLIPAWNNGLVGVPVGSRVMLVVPPAQGYGKTGQSSAGINGTDTLVFVVDVLAAAT
ncbi:MAG TPA: FKBP-type peptidyl-prolyl cis-trans isomerase [Streptosporangiaceae bacterium]|nr:FKBP-type peptidyl-prolyl cis-trans isomerase [Streptosporangiaceae bacterium]